MLHVACSACGKQVEIEDLLAAARQPCPHCGQFIMGGGAPPVPSSPAGPPAAPWEKSDRPGGVVGLWLRLYNWGVSWLGPEVLIRRDEAHRLPRVCMVCGAAAELEVDHSFVNPRASDYSVATNSPELFSQTPYSKAYGPWFPMRVPLCNAHRWYFGWGILRIFAVALIVAGFAGLVRVLSVHTPILEIDWLPAWLEIAICAAFMVLGIAGLFPGSGGLCGIRPISCYQDYIDLRGVSPRFVEALNRQRAHQLEREVP